MTVSPADIPNANARLALEGLSLGDAFGQRFFRTNPEWVMQRQLPPPRWHWTDDTAMAICIVETMERFGEINQNALADTFASRYSAEPDRGYGSGAQRILRHLVDGGDWRELSRAAFGGEGSLGNGGAMRAAPVGGYFCGDLKKVVEQARLSAEITHAHDEGIAGAVAVAIAAAVACENRNRINPRVKGDVLDAVIELMPRGYTHEGVQRARQLRRGCSVVTAVRALGNGTRLIAADTVPFALWCASTHLDNYVEAMWTTVTAGGDLDTNAAIVGGVVALAVGDEGLPQTWLEHREALPDARCH